MAPFQRNQFRSIIALVTIPLVFCLFGFTNKGANTENGHYQVNIEMMEKIHVGNNSMKMKVIKQIDKRPIDQDSVVDIVTWMTVHEHGTKISPVIKPLGDGNYSIEMLNFTMKGPWDILIRITKDDIEDTAVLTVNVDGGAEKGSMQMSSKTKMMGQSGQGGMQMDKGAMQMDNGTQMMGH